MTEALNRILPGTAGYENGGLQIGGYSLKELAAEYGTPLYVYDEATLRKSARDALRAFSPLGARVSFASKACSTLAVLRVFCEEGLDLDCVSGGEMEAARRAGFSPNRVHLHGNCKSREEIARAVEWGVRAIVLDNLEEIQCVIAASKRVGRRTRVMLRLALPIEAETHPHLQTSGRRVKFGIFHTSTEEERAIDLIRCAPELELIGVHAHLGSQINDAAVYGRAAETLLSFAGSLQNCGAGIREVGVGGGWAVPYRPGDPSLAPEAVAGTIAGPFKRVPGIRAAVEPGRALVARAAVALYRVGSVKTAGELRLVSVDGGMGDNIRPALYNARYHALLPERMDAAPAGRADIVGRYCESGDVLVRDVELGTVEPDDLVCVPMAGAYQLSMALRYNRVPAPPAVMVRDGRARPIVRREEEDELFARELL